MESQGVLEQNMADAGYDYTLQYSWDGAPLFVSGQMDVVHTSPLENARMGPEQGVETSVSGRIVADFEGFWAPPGSRYDPDEVGDVRTAVDNMIADDATLVHGSWAGGNIPPGKILMDSYGYDFSEEGDFTIVTAAYTAIPRLLSEGEADVALTSPMHGGGRYVLDGAMVPIAQFPPWFQAETGFVPPLMNVTTRQSFADENPEAVRAMVETWSAGADFLYENGAGVIADEDDVGNLGCSTMRGAQYAMEWGLGEDVEYAMDQEVIHEDAFLDDEYVEGQTAFLDAAGERGLVPADWADYVSFRQMG
jgi:hypothetical protein